MVKWFLIPIVVIAMMSVAFGVGLESNRHCEQPDIQVTEWQSPNGLDRCYIARDGGGHFDLACVEVKK